MIYGFTTLKNFLATHRQIIDISPSMHIFRKYIYKISFAGNI